MIQSDYASFLTECRRFPPVHFISPVLAFVPRVNIGEDFPHTHQSSNSHFPFMLPNDLPQGCARFWLRAAIQWLDKSQSPKQEGHAQKELQLFKVLLCYGRIVFREHLKYEEE